MFKRKMCEECYRVFEEMWNDFPNKLPIGKGKTIYLGNPEQDSMGFIFVYDIKEIIKWKKKWSGKE